MPVHFSASVKDLLSKLLVKDPTKRLGSNGVEEIKNHKFFANVNWEDVLLLKKNPPIIPLVVNAADLRNFDPEYRNQQSEDTPVKDPEILKNRDDAFPDFSFQGFDLERESYAEDASLLASKLN